MWRSQDYVKGIIVLHIFVGLFSTFSFWMLGDSLVDMQSRLFAIFMTLIIAPPLMQQLQPRFLEARNIYTSREAKAKIYSWFGFVTGAIAAEIPYRIIAGTLYWACWYFGIGFPRGHNVPFKMWMLIILFELFYLGLGLGIASFSPSESLASFFIPLFFMFVISFCGIAVPFFAIPKFWKWMYHFTPFTYALEAMLGLVIHEVPITCSRDELAIIRLPPGLSCQSYMDPHIKLAGGYVETLSDGFCGFCQFKTGDEFVSHDLFHHHQSGTNFFHRESASTSSSATFGRIFASLARTSSSTLSLCTLAPGFTSRVGRRSVRGLAGMRRGDARRRTRMMDLSEKKRNVRCLWFRIKHYTQCSWTFGLRVIRRL
jgi:ABC-type multidrug transport system permease subunit